MNTLLFESPNHKILNRPKCSSGKDGSTQSILVGDHQQFIIKFTRNLTHEFKYMRIEFEFFK